MSVSPTLPCGTPINLTLAVSDGVDSASVPLSIATGVTGPLTSYAGVPLVIGDATPTIRPRLAALSSAGTASVDARGLVRAVEVTIGELLHPDISHVGTQPQVAHRDRRAARQLRSGRAGRQLS